MGHGGTCFLFDLRHRRTWSWSPPSLEQNRPWMGLGCSAPLGAFDHSDFMGWTWGVTLHASTSLYFSFMCMLIYFHFILPTILSPFDLWLVSEDLNNHI